MRASSRLCWPVPPAAAFGVGTAAPDTRSFTEDAAADVDEAEPLAEGAPLPVDVEAPPVDDVVPPLDDVVPPEPVVVDEPEPADELLSDIPDSSSPGRPLSGEEMMGEARIDPMIDILNDLKFLAVLPILT